jgi:hypothetical protein
VVVSRSRRLESISRNVKCLENASANQSVEWRFGPLGLSALWPPNHGMWNISLS